jgi:hypothetical protein
MPNTNIVVAVRNGSGTEDRLRRKDYPVTIVHEITWEQIKQNVFIKYYGRHSILITFLYENISYMVMFLWRTFQRQ